MWHDYFDKIYVVNLPDRIDRREYIETLFGSLNIPFQLFTATKHAKGAIGLNLTMKRLFNDAIANNYQRILVFEDDVCFIDDINLMDKCVAQMPANWNLFYLGVNAIRPLQRFMSDNVIKLESCYAAHAVAYNRPAFDKIIRYIDFLSPLPYDVILSRNFKDSTYCAYPMLASQKASYSDIEKKDVNYNRFMPERFNKAVAKLK